MTAFCIDSFQALSPNPAEKTNTILLAISRQLADSNSPSAEALLAEDNFTASKSDVTVNVLYFVSLALTLTVSSICILGKQWIREFRRDIPGSSSDILRLRQLRYDALYRWNVPLILSGLPAILQVALLLFFAGLLQQLWNVQDHTTVSAVSVIVGIAVLVVTASTIIPAHFSRRGDCKRFTPFYSPQAWIYLFMYQQVVRLCVFITQKLFRMQWNSHYTPTPFSGSWAAYDLEYLTHENEKIAKSQTTDEDQVTSIHLVLRSAFEALGNVKDIGNSIFWCLQSPLPRPFSTAGIGNKGKNMGSYVTRLGLYVFYGEKTNPQLPSFEQSCPRTTDSPTVLSSRPPEMTLYNSRGQLHSELLIRDANHILSTLESMPRAGQAALEDGVTRFEETCMKLCNFEGMFYAEDENLGKHYPILKHVDQGLMHLRSCYRSARTGCAGSSKVLPSFTETHWDRGLRLPAM